MAEQDEPLEFEIGPDGHAVRVKGWDGLMRWLEGEWARWEWLRRGDGRTDQHGWATQVQNQWDNIRNQLPGVRAQGGPVQNALPYLAAFGPGGQLLASESALGTLVQEVRESAGDVAGAFAYAFLKGGFSGTQITSPEALLGAVLTVLPDLREPAEIGARLQRERRNYRSSMRSISDRLDQDNQEREQRFVELLSRGKEIGARIIRRRRDSWKAQQDAWQAQATDAVSSIRAVEHTFLEAMQLQAPVEYWRRKANEHGEKEVKARKRLIWYFPTTAVALIVGFVVAGNVIIENSPGPNESAPLALYVVISGGLAFLSTLAFWVGRLLSKLYLSEHHLRNDASERAIMTETYLALTKESAAGDADRQIVLNALFRNTPDGIVKEEGPSEFNASALLSRLLGPR